MPFSSSDDSQNLQLAPQSATSAALPPQQMLETAAGGVDSQKYSNLDFWAAQMRATTWGQGTSNLMLKSAYNAPLIPNADDPALADGRVPAGLEQYADQFVGLHTPEEVNYKAAQIRQKLDDQRIMASNGYSTAIQFPLQALDPTNLALMFTPLAETRLANSIRQAIAAAAAGGAQEAVTHELDPTHVYGLQSLENVGSSALLGGIFGAAIKPRIPAEEYERLRAHLEAELEARVDQQFGGPGGPGDTADKIARDLKARLAEHGEALERTAGEHAGAVEGIDPKEVEARIQDAQERLRAAQEPLDPEARAKAIEAEVERLQTPEAVKARLVEQHGEKLPDVLQERAAANVDAGNEGARQTAAKAQADLDSALADQAALERAASSRAELERFRVITPPAEPEPVPQGEANVAPAKPSLRSDVPAAKGTVEPGRGESAEPVLGADAERAARGPEGVPGRAGQPLAVRPASVRGTPLEGLGNIFEADTGEGAGQGARLALQRPLELRSDEVPKFDTVKQARAWATEQIARGHDGLVIDSSHLGGPTHYVSFHPDQVNHPSIDRYAGMISSAPRVEAQVYDQLKELGRFDDKQIRAYAAIVGDFYGTQAKRLGITGDELFQRFPLNVTQGEAAAGALGQSESDAFKTWSAGAPLISREMAATHVFKTGEPVVVEAYHGTARPDRVGEVMRRSRATSGPMPYHTSDPELASNYAKGKADTSLSREDTNYPSWYRLKVSGLRNAVNLDDAWHHLDPQTQARIRERAPTITRSDWEDGEHIVSEPGNTRGTGGYDQNLKEARGNPLRALIAEWLESGNLYGREHEFHEVLKTAGVPMDRLEFHDPNATSPFVYKNFIAMRNPLVTTDIPASVDEALSNAAARDRSKPGLGGADSWDKERRTLREWVTQLRGNDGRYAWTSIPDKVTKVLKDLGYDGIIDRSGKGGGPEHPVYVPFTETQVKSAVGNRGTFDPSSKNMLRQQLRGTYDPNLREISLLPTADVSTFLHEAGHHFLDVMGQLAAQHDAPFSIREDFDQLMKWFGIHDPLMGAEAWTGRSMDEQRPYHEQFARAFEEYLQEGRAPSPRLQTIFEKFRTWLTEAYRSLSVFNEHTPEVRGVMDRMLADEAEIRAARQERIEAAATPATKRLAADDELRDSLRNMAERETGWAQKGGEMIRREIDGGRGNEFEISRTSWIPNSEWWAERPGSYSAEEVSNIVEKALAGQKLGKTQQRLLEHMIEAHDQRIASEAYLPQAQELTLHGLDPGNPEHEANVAITARLRAIDEDLVEQLAIRHGDDDAGFMDAVRSALHANDEDAKISRSIPQRVEPPAVDPSRGSAAGSDGAAESGGRLAQAARKPVERVRGAAGEQPDLLGERTDARQRLADETRRRDLARNSGQESVETGDPNDLFSAARRQGDLFGQSPRTLRDDLHEQLARLPEADRAQFEARIAALDHPAPKRVPLYAAPGDSTAGAAQKDPRLAELHANTYARGGRVLGRLTGWFAPGSRALRSPFLSMRKAALRLLETPETLNKNVPTDLLRNGVPTETSVEAKLKRWEGSWATAWSLRDQLYRQYRNRPLSDMERNQGRMDKHAFNEAISNAMRRGDIHETPEVEKAAQMTRKVVFDPLKVEAQKLGLLGADEGMLKGTANTYLMRQYDRAKINADPRGWHDILVDHFMTHDGLEAAEASDVAHKVTMNIKGSELGLLDSNARVFDQVGDSGRLKERQLLMPDEKLERYLVSDIDTLSHSYLKSLAPQVEIMKAFPGDDRNLKQTALDLTDEFKILKQRALVENDTHTADQLDQRLNRDLRDLAAMRDRLYGMFSTPADPSHWAVRAGRAIRSMNGFRMLGTATFSHIPDLANVVMRRGLPQTFATAARMLSDFKALNLTREQIHRVGAAVDMIHNSTAAQLGEFGIESSYGYQKALNRGMRAFTIATLETPLIASTKMLSGTAAHDEILEAAERVFRHSKLAEDSQLSRLEKIRFNTMGLGQNELSRIGEMFKEYGRTVNGLRFGMSDLWHDRGAAEALDAATAMAADASTLHPSAGDTPLWTSSEIGKAIFQFKSFGAVAIRKILIPLAQGLAHGDARAFQGLATLIGAGTLTYLSKQALSGQPVEQNPARFALEVLDKSNLLGWTGEYFYPALWAMGANNFSRWGDRQTWETLGGPVAGTAADIWDLRLPAKIMGQMTHDPKTHFSRGDLHRIRRLLPANQVWYLRRGVNALEGKVGDWMGLPPEAPRGSTE